ncbi:MAG: Aspartate aminotransferase [Methanomassiliicoccales archaeon PtaU1.Bin124]|nr:MAG: Aspartate aminotransferase [Methanomassiliicoccales archaeon PtaU1.Bin124]
MAKNLDVSDRSRLIVQSEIRNMTLECIRVGGLNLAQGVCDLDVPQVVIDSAYEAMRQGINAYTRYDGLPIIREAIAHKFRTFNDAVLDPEKNIIVSAGATGAFYSACLALLNPGDEVIVLEPFYQYHVNTLLAVGAVPKYVPMSPPDWTLDVDAVKKVIGPKTKAIIVNTPGNPSGKVFTRKELEDLAAICHQNNMFLFSDEIYEYFVYDGRKHISPWSIKELRDRAIVISGYSKTFSITGWRLGYCVCDEKWAQMIGYVNDLVYVCAPAPLQVGVAKGIMQLPSSYYENVARTYQQKRDEMVAALRTAGLEPYVPHGAYYILADVSHLPGETSKERALQILHERGVASVPGSAFYSNGGGEDLVRFCFAKKDDILTRACQMLKG